MNLNRVMGLQWRGWHFLGLAMACGVLVSGCKTVTEDQQAALAAAATQAAAASERGAAVGTGAVTNEAPREGSRYSSDRLLLREGDTLKVTFPGAPNLNTLQVIRRDGKITLPLVGEVQAAGVAPTDLEKRLIDLYGPQLQTKEVTVALESSAFPVYVVGAVLRPGKIVSDRPISALEAIMEAGGFDQARANLKRVRVIRYVDGKPEYHNLNMKGILGGQGSTAFQLRPTDIIFVPEKFTWF